MTTLCTAHRCWRPATVRVPVQGLYMTQHRRLCDRCAEGLPSRTTEPQAVPAASGVPSGPVRVRACRWTPQPDGTPGRTLRAVVARGVPSTTEARRDMALSLGIRVDQLTRALSYLRRGGHIHGSTATDVGRAVVAEWGEA